MTTTQSSGKGPRTTPAERAKAAVEVLERKVGKLKGRRDAARAEAAAAEREIGEVERRLEYARSNPDLPREETPEPERSVIDPVEA